MIQNWGLPDKTSGTLIWISSPSLDQHGIQRVNVFYRLENEEYHHACLNWSQLHYLNLGYQYVNWQKPIYHENSVVGSLTSEDIKNMLVQDCRNINSNLISFSNHKMTSNISKLKRPDLYFQNQLNEKCLKVTKPDSVIYIPCIVACKGLFGAYRGTVNSILNERELDEYFDEIVYNFPDNLEVKLTSLVPSELTANDSLRYLLWLRFTPCIYNEYNNTSTYIKDNLITTRIPLEIKQNISFSGIQYINSLNIKHILVQNLHINGLSLPYRTITVMLPNSETTTKDNENKGYVSKIKESEENINETSTFAGSDNGTTDELDYYCPYTFSQDFIVDKEKNKSIEKLSTVKCKDDEVKDLKYTTNESGIGFSAKPVGTEYSNSSEVNIKPLNIIEGLNDFCSAINLLNALPNINHVDIISGEFNGNREYCINDDGTARIYAIVSILLLSEKRVYIFEAQQNRHPLSTLIIYAPEHDLQIAALQVETIISNGNGSFNTKYLNACFGRNYYLLSHYPCRKPLGWAYLLWNKLLK